MIFKMKKIAAFGLVLAFSGVFFACTDSGSGSKVSGGVTDIGNSIAFSGRVVDSDGMTVPSARVVAYYDGWQQLGIKDSVETVAGKDGSFELMLDSAADVVLYASSGEYSGFALPDIRDDASTIAIGSRKNYSGQIGGRHTGSVRIVGSDASTKLDSDGYFIFYDMPHGDVMIAYTDSTNGVNIQSRVAFTTVGERLVHVLPELHFLKQDTSWLTASRSQYYEEDGVEGIRIYEPRSEVWELPADEPEKSDSSEVEKPQQKLSLAAPKVSGSLDGFVIPVKLDLSVYSDSIKPSDIAIFQKFADESDDNESAGDYTALSCDVEYWSGKDALIWVRLAGNQSGDSMTLWFVEDREAAESVTSMKAAQKKDGVVASLHMNGDATVYDNDSSKAVSTADSVGLFGKGLTLNPGQYIDLDTLNPTGGDFTISLWTKWNGPNGYHQILVSQRAYWSDSTSRFQWHFEGVEGWFTAMKNLPKTFYAVYFGNEAPIDVWSNMVLVSRNHMLSMYINGEVLYTSEDDGTLVSEYEFIPNDLSRSVPFRVGGNEISDETWNGALDEVRIETVARSAEWIRAQYEAYKSAL